MKTIVRLTIVASLVLSIPAVMYFSIAAEKSIEITVSDPVPYARIYSDSEGHSHFADETLPFKLADYAPPAPPISVSEVFKADTVSFISSPSGWFGDWHPAPCRQFVIVLKGELEVEASDGEKRRFEPGSFVIVEDTTGKGHISRVVSSERVLAAAIPLSEK